MNFLRRTTFLADAQFFRLLYCWAVAYFASKRLVYLWLSKSSGIFQGFLLFPHWGGDAPLSIVVLCTSLMAICLILNGLGIKTKITAPLSLFFFVNGFFLTEQIYQDYDSDIVFFNLLVICFLESAPLFSFKMKNTEMVVPSWPMEFVKVNLALSYFAAFVSKVINTNGEWILGPTLQGYLLERALMTGNALAHFVADHLWICTILSIFTLASEALFWMVLLPNKWLQRVTILVGLALHVGVTFTMGIYFKLFAISYFVFIPYSAILKKLWTLRKAPVSGKA